ncbi:MAG: NAD(P)H-dependent oxidoreductase [Candidatus Krumholzibacteria bacterium]|nr:NAD(P)H-dependent oxidoreductase [Candidatus Krumholzibacteria bacterium]
MSLHIVVVYGSVRRQRRGIRAARFVERQLRERGHEVTLIDPLERPLPLLDLTYKEYEKGQAPALLEEIASIYRAADAFVFVTGEYNHSLSPALKNLIDHFMNEYFWRPAGIVSYSAGPFGGVRAAVHLRTVLGEVGLVTIPSMFPVSHVEKSFDEDGKPLDETYVRRSGRFFNELEWYARALAEARKKGVPYE